MRWQHVIWEGFNPTAALRTQICSLYDSGICMIVFGVAALYLEYTGNTLLQNAENNYQILVRRSPRDHNLKHRTFCGVFEFPRHKCSHFSAMNLSVGRWWRWPRTVFGPWRDMLGTNRLHQPSRDSRSFHLLKAWTLSETWWILPEKEIDLV